MPKDTPSHANRANANSALNGLWSPRSDPLQMWSRTCDLYSRYFAALSRAQSPEGLMAANAEFLAAGMEAIGNGSAAGEVRASGP